MVDIARKRNEEEIEILSSSSFYRWFDDAPDIVEKGRPYGRHEGKPISYGMIITDFDAAHKHIAKKLDEEIPSVLDIINKGQSADPENSLYDYLRARLYFELDKQDKALEQIENAAKKKQLNYYKIERTATRAKVLEKINYPRRWRHLISPNFIFVMSLRSSIWRNRLYELGQSYEEQGDFEKSKRMYELGLVLSEQIRHEPRPYFTGYNQGLADYIQKFATERINQLNEKINTKNSP